MLCSVPELWQLKLKGTWKGGSRRRKIPRWKHSFPKMENCVAFGESINFVGTPIPVVQNKVAPGKAEWNLPPSRGGLEGWFDNFVCHND